MTEGRHFFSDLFWEIMAGIELSYIAFLHKIENFLFSKVLEKKGKNRAGQDMKRTIGTIKIMWGLVHGRGRAQLSKFMLWASSPCEPCATLTPIPGFLSRTPFILVSLSLVKDLFLLLSGLM